MNIAITGSPGSGKTTLCKVLQSDGWNVVSSESVFRAIAQERGLDIVTLDHVAHAKLDSDTSLHDAVDQRTAHLSQSLDHTVFDGRMAWYFAKDSFKVFLFCSPIIAAERMQESKRIAEAYSSHWACIKALIDRQAKENDRFLALYGVDYLDVSNYDLAIDTSHLSPQEILNLVKNAIQKGQSADTLDINALKPQ